VRSGRCGEEPVDAADQLAFERSERFAAGLAFGDAAGEIRARGRVNAIVCKARLSWRLPAQLRRWRCW
jgi:hypothetical protein